MYLNGGRNKNIAKENLRRISNNDMISFSSLGVTLKFHFIYFLKEETRFLQILKY